MATFDPKQFPARLAKKKQVDRVYSNFALDIERRAKIDPTLNFVDVDSGEDGDESLLEQLTTPPPSPPSMGGRVYSNFALDIERRAKIDPTLNFVDVDSSEDEDESLLEQLTTPPPSPPSMGGMGPFGVPELPPVVAVVASDHAGFPLVGALRAHAAAKGFGVVSRGPDPASGKVDYPDCVAKVVAELLRAPGQKKIGVLVCGTGMGMCMGANRFNGIRAVVCRGAADAQIARKHNNANVLCLGARGTTSVDGAKAIFDAFAETEYEGGRHDARLRKLDALRP